MFGIDDLLLAGVAAGGSLLSGLGARSSAKSQARHQAAMDAKAREQTDTAMSMMRDKVPHYIVADADKAGFNPVTWLNAGALGYYYNMFSAYAGTPGQAINIPSVGSAIGGAVSSLAGSLSASNAQNKKLAFEQSALDQQLGAIKGRLTRGTPYADAIGALSGANTPMYGAGSIASTKGVGGTLAPSGKGGVTEPWKKVGYGSDAYSPDAATVSDRGGDIVEEVAGIYNTFVADPIWNATGMSLTKGIADAGNWTVNNFGGTKPTPQDMTQFFSGPEGAWKMMTRNVPDYGSEAGKAVDAGKKYVTDQLSNYSWTTFKNRIAPFFVNPGNVGPTYSGAGM